MSPALVAHELRDSVGYVRFNILEDDEATGRMKVRGRFQMADTKNANGRIYSSSLWEKTLSDPKLLEAIQGRRMLGEVEHPKDGVTNLNRVSHIITGLDRKGNEIIGEAMVLNTPSGKVIQELFRAGTEVGISSRGRGTSQIRGGSEYVDENNFQLDTFDFVFKPSTPGAYPKLQESVLGNSPYGKDSTMDEKLNELKRVELRAEDIIKEANKDALSQEEMQSWFEECIELEASADSILANLSEDEQESHSDAVQTAVTKVTEARSTIVAKLDRFHESNDADLDRRAAQAEVGIVESTEEDLGTTTPVSSNSTTQKSESQIKQLQALLKEALRSRDHYRTRLAETMEVLESDEDELMQRYVAAKRLGEELLVQLGEARHDLAEIAQDHEALEERYQAATAVIAGVMERQDRSRLMKRVREAIEMHPELLPFHKSLLACESYEELEERLAEYCDALELPTQDKEEAMVGQVNISAAKEEGDEDETDEEDDDGETPMGERSDLPNAGASINESEDSEVLSETQDELLEHHEDRGVAATHRMLKQRAGWK